MSVLGQFKNLQPFRTLGYLHVDSNFMRFSSIDREVTKLSLMRIYYKLIPTHLFDVRCEKGLWRIISPLLDRNTFSIVHNDIDPLSFNMYANYKPIKEIMLSYETEIADKNNRNLLDRDVKINKYSKTIHTVPGLWELSGSFDNLRRHSSNHHDNRYFVFNRMAALDNLEDSRKFIAQSI